MATNAVVATKVTAMATNTVVAPGVVEAVAPLPVGGGGGQTGCGGQSGAQ